MEQYTKGESEYLSKITAEVPSSYMQQISGGEKEAFTRVRNYIASGRELDSATSCNVTDYAGKLGIIANSLEYLGLMGVNRFILGRSPLSQVERWGVNRKQAYKGSDCETAQKSTALLRTMKPVHDEPILVDLKTPVGRRAGAILGFFEKQLGDFLRKVSEKDLGMDNGEVVETLSQVAENLDTGEKDLQFTREMRATKILAELLAGPVNVVNGKVSSQIIPQLTHVSEAEATSKGYRLALSLWSHDMRTFWSEGVTHVDIDEVLNSVEEHGEHYELPEYDPTEVVPMRNQVLSNAMFISTLRYSEMNDPEEIRVAVGVVNFLLRKSEAELAGIRKNLQKFM